MIFSLLGHSRWCDVSRLRSDRSQDLPMHQGEAPAHRDRRRQRGKARRRVCQRRAIEEGQNGSAHSLEKVLTQLVLLN